MHENGTHTNLAVRHRVRFQVDLALDAPPNSQTTDVKNIKVLSTSVENNSLLEQGGSHLVSTAINHIPTVNSEKFENLTNKLTISQPSQGNTNAKNINSDLATPQ